MDHILFDPPSVAVDIFFSPEIGVRREDEDAQGGDLHAACRRSRRPADHHQEDGDEPAALTHLAVIKGVEACGAGRHTLKE